MTHAFFSSVRRIARQPGFPLLLLGNFMLGGAFSLVVPFMSLFGTVEVGMSSLGFGVFMTVTSLSGIVISTVAAKWSDTHVTRRTMLLVGGSGGAIGYLGYALVRDPIGLTVIGMTAVALSQVCFSQIFAHGREELTRETANAPHVPFFMSVLRMAFSLAWTVGPAMGAIIMVSFGYRGIFLGTTLLFAAFITIVLVAVPDRPHPPLSAKVPQLSLRAALSRPDILAHFVAFVCIFAAHSINMMNLPLLILRELGGTESDVGIVFGIAPIFELPLFVWFGQLAARGHEARLIKLGGLFALIYYAGLLTVHTPTQIYPLQILSAASIAVTTGVAITFFQDFLPGQIGTATSIYANSFSVGSLLGYFGFGLVLPAVGHRGMFGVCLGLVLICVVILFVTKPRPLLPRTVAA